MIVTAQDLAALTETLPDGAHLILPDRIEVERPGESLGHLYRDLKGLLAYRSYS